MAPDFGTRETILVVDDDNSVLRIVVAILRHDNYHVLEAGSASEALLICREYPGFIHLLLADVTMPAMSGPELASEIKEARPDVRVMFMSGHVDGTLLILNHGWSFVQKPFVMKVLLERVASALRTPIGDQGTDHFDTRR